jgi:hypothetical protein
VTDDEADRILSALSGEGFVLPFGGPPSSDYLHPGMEGEARREAIGRLKAAEAKVDRQNRDALRRAIQCTNEYAECSKYDRRCVQRADHVVQSPLHYNRAGFAWSDDEARESAARVRREQR